MNARSWFLPGAVAVVVTGAVLGVTLAGRSPRPAASPAASPPASRVAAIAAAPPAWPSEHPPPPPGPHDADLRAGRVRVSAAVDPGPGFAATVDDLRDASPYIAVVVALSQKSYWGERGAMTATNYRVERVVKGVLPSRIQVSEFGAEPNSFPDSARAWMPRNDVAPRVGARYVLFLRRDLGGGRYTTRDGCNSRFEVVDGVVRSILDRHPAAALAIPIPPTPLAAFLARLGG